MTGAITINLPLKAYLIKYLVKKYGKYHIVNRTSWLGSYLIELLDKQYRRKGNIKNGDFYSLVVSKEIIQKVGFDMPAIKYKKLEQMIDKLFRNELYSYIEISIENNLLVKVNKGSFDDSDKQIINKQNVINAMKQFFKTYNITEDDIKLETIYRDHARYVNKFRTENKKSKNTCSPA